MPKKIQIPIEVLEKAKIHWMIAIKQNTEKQGGCVICDFIKEKADKHAGHDKACQYCPLHPKICCEDKPAHKRLPLYWRYRNAYETKSADLTKLAEECASILDQMITKHS